jgi:sugar phosphate isomerase/epimerase
MTPSEKETPVRKRALWILPVLLGTALVTSAMAKEEAPKPAAEVKKPATFKLTLMAYTYRERPLMETIDAAKDLKIRFLETFSWQKIGGDYPEVAFNQDAPMAALAAVKNKLDDDKVKLVGFYFHELGKDPEVTRKVFDFCKLMDIPTIICEPRPEDFDRVEKLADQYNINVAVHNHVLPSPNGDPKTVMAEIAKRGPHIGACPDTGHWVRSGLNPVDCLKMYQGKIVHVHMKDVNHTGKDGEDVPWGKGIGKVAAQLAELKRQGYTGPISIEYESHPENPTPDVKACLRSYHQTMKKLQP